ncbi:bifunctional GNAT family N-acetyltransferase/acetate--CoA ligase family protein [Nostocoides sp. Soil756]|jgi:acyl-CoA synthetase (NDP forming)/RimJ/RimL family protein N-acetyltransferase|uniref:bifunctional acetate--CoA ligase family protein/GNAT family N-acetyltransferase n=1 Tax=Nostocoides sp. Soil756 TaxID=1736399 RepID=UPI0006F8F42D|nr:bifunctional GNAT family N-acetyltransferase/acetate--CoA ligase family protein [Tetrasphaera sp. Soil756]KRE62995.1 multidrug ABC transporter permease [Tetrasphaera sp. Soil756]
MVEGTLPPGYPVQWEADVVLRDGTVAGLRPIRPDDAEGIHRFHAAQSAESIYLRFFAPLRRLSEADVHRFTHVDYVDRVALVVTMREEIIGIGRFDRLDSRSAEVAFNISDHYQGKGIGSVLLEHLAAIARDLGITRFIAEVLPQNRKMLAVFSDAGYEVTRRVEDGVVEVGFDIEPTDRSRAVEMSREHRAEAQSLRVVLNPGTIAVIGASRDRHTFGGQLLDRVISSGFAGRLVPVNPRSRTLRRLTTYASVVDVPGEVDLAIVAVPAAAVLGVVDECAEKGVKALLVVSSGFAESGPEGEVRQAELVRRARGAGMRVIGPNSFGIINNDPEVRLNASLAPTLPPLGRLGLFSQSGALGIAVLASAARRNLGISTFGSAGNRADVSGNDFMQYWIDDDSTDAVGLYLESMGNPRKFSRIARKLALIKPVIVVKSGVSRFGVPPGHTVRETQARPEVFAAMLKQAGVIRVENVHQLFDVAQIVVHQPLPRGSRVAVVVNSDALGALTADACTSWGLTVTHGPVTLPSEATAEDFRTALDAAFADDRVDSVLTGFIPPLATGDADVAAAVRGAADGADKPCVATFLGLRGVDDGHASVKGTGGSTRAIPVYTMPEDAVRALAAATRYGEWRHRDHGTPVAPAGINRRIAEDVVGTVLSVTPEGRRLTHDEATALLAAYGVEVWGQHEVASVDEAVEAAERLGWPVVLKSVAPLVRHQGGSGVRLDLGDAASLRMAWASLSGHLAPLRADRFVVQKMASNGVPCVVTSDEDPLFGPVIGFSVAGLPTELLDDVAHRIPPLTDVTVSELISSIKAAPVLHGYRGRTPVHRAALADLIARVSVLADDMPEIASLVLNPVNAHPGGVEVLGAEITLAPAPRRIDPGRRSLT